MEKLKEVMSAFNLCSQLMEVQWYEYGSSFWRH